jgi:hypothetical protein
MKIVIPDVYLSKQKAIQHVEILAKKLNISIPSYNQYEKDIFLDNGTKKFRLNFSEEVSFVQKHGKARMLQIWFDAEDVFLQPAIEMSTFSTIPGINTIIGYEIGNYKAELKNCGILEAPENSLANDICFYFESTCTAFNSEDIKNISRYFRSFLHSCVSIIDCFLFRYSFYVKQHIKDYDQYDNIKILDSRLPIEERLDAWMQTFATQDSCCFKTWKERSQFMELKLKRNEFTHPVSPVTIYNPQDIVKYLNIGSVGVGQLLARMRRSSSLTDRIGFIHQVASLPKIRLLN